MEKLEFAGGTCRMFSVAALMFAASLDMRVLPPDWSCDWNGGQTRITSFSDAPLPVTVLLRGDKRKLKAPALEVDVPDELELKDAFCPFAATCGRDTPASSTRVAVDGASKTRIRFEKLRYFEKMLARFNMDPAGGVSLVIGPKKGGGKLSKSFQVVCRTMDGGCVLSERAVEMVFRPLPRGLRTSKRFVSMGWFSDDRRFSDDAALKAALPAYEAAGIRMVRLDGRRGESAARRVDELRSLLGRRPAPFIFAAGLGDVWNPKASGLSEEELAAMGGRLCETNVKEKPRTGRICPQFFTTDEAFRRRLEERAVRPALEKSGVKDGDWVTLDVEPWGSGTYCFCEECRKAFAGFAKLDHVPTVEEASAKEMKKDWAEFRVRHTAKTIEIVCDAVHRYNPTLKLMDYDYIVEHGNARDRAAFIRDCAKDTLMNEQWIDGHICSYYHRVGKASFEAMKNNVRNLKKPYYPMAALSGYSSSWVRKGEVLSPAQIRQFALAAFVNGCPGYAFYPGNYFDGEVLVAMMEAQDLAARYEDLPWGRVDGKVAVETASAGVVYASTVRPGGSEVVAVFNYDGEKAAEVRVAGEPHSIPPYGVKFVEVKKVAR